jgi:hypothetical protein
MPSPSPAPTPVTLDEFERRLKRAADSAIAAMREVEEVWREELEKLVADAEAAELDVKACAQLIAGASLRMLREMQR